METNLELSPIATNCKSCSVSVNEADQFCQSCGFPLKGNEQDQENFIYNRNYQHLSLQELDKKIKSAGTTLYVLAGFTLVYGLVMYFLSNDPAEAISVLIANGVISIIYLLLAVWSKKKPAAAIISALTLFALTWILNAFVDPTQIFKGVIVKVIVIVYLVKGMQSAFEAEKIRKQHNIA